LFVLEADNEKFKNHKNVFVEDIILLIQKLFLSKKLSEKDILLLLKFVSFMSFRERKEINKHQQSMDLLMNLSNSQIKYYDKFEFVFELIKRINYPKITYEYCQFLQKNIFKNKENYNIFIQKEDLLNFLFLKDEQNKILYFLAEIFSFKFNKKFMNIFMNKIKETYDIKNKNTNSIDILSKLDKTIAFISELKKIEDNQYHKDPFLLSKSFSLNNDKLNGIYINDITIQTSFSIIFSFCFSPNETKKNKKDVKEYPILHLVKTIKMNYIFLSKMEHYFIKIFAVIKRSKYSI
jgi:hypothetical protein